MNTAPSPPDSSTLSPALYSLSASQRPRYALSLVMSLPLKYTGNLSMISRASPLWYSFSAAFSARASSRPSFRMRPLITARASRSARGSRDKSV